MIDPTTQQLLSILHRGGAYGYWWVLEGQQSFWWEVGKMTPLPGGKRNMYFGVHPTTCIPTHNPRGEPKPERSLRAQLPIIAALNCLYTEYDAKDFGGDKAAARAAADAIEPPPSVLIDSGGGYHLYWLLETPWLLSDDDTRDHAKRLQAAWVAYAGGDKAVKDLARVLRVPGTLNHKYEPPRKVQYVYAAFNRRYTAEALQALCSHLMEEEQLPDVAPSSFSTSDDRDRRYVQAALDREVAGVMRAPAGLKHDAIRDASIRLGTLAGRGLLADEQIVDELTRAANLHRADVKDTHRTILDGLAYGKARPRSVLPSSNAASTSMREPPPQEEADGLPLLLRASELSRIPPAEELVVNLIYTKKIHQFFGPPGSGKSFLALDIAATIAQYHPVLYIAAEAIEDYENRINAWQAHYEQTVDRLFFWRLPLSLADERAVDHFITTAKTIRPIVVILDPLADCMTGLNENDPRDMSIAVYALNTIRRKLNAAVVVVHHTGWSTEHERGHSTLRAACRVVAKVEAREDGLIRLTCEKKNHGRKFDPRSFRLVQAGTMGGVLPLPARMVIPGKLRLEEKLLRILEALTTEPLRRGATHTQLLQDTGITAATLNRSLTALTEAGYVRSEDNGRSRLWSLTETGRDALDMAFEEKSESWSGRTLEEGGRTWNWEVASSAVSPHQDAVLPSPSKTLPSTPLFPPLGGKGGTETGDKVLPPQSDAYANRVNGFRVLELGEQEDELFPEPQPAPAVSRFDLEYVRRVWNTGQMDALHTHYRLTRPDVRGQSREAVFDLAAAELGIELPEDSDDDA